MINKVTYDSSDADLSSVDRNQVVKADDGRVASDPDASYGVKTRKDGKREVFFGYELHALVRAPDGSAHDDFIPLFEAFELTPAGTDTVAPSLGLLSIAA